MDIAREYLSKLDKKILEQNEKFQKLEEILRKGFQYPNIELSELLVPKYEKIKKNNYLGNFDVVEKISFGDGKIHIRDKRETGMDLYKAEAGDLVTSKINVHQGAMALSPSDLVCSTHYQIYSIKPEVNPKYLLLVLRSEKFLQIVNIEKAGGIKNEAGAEFLGKFKIPLPPLEVQNEIVEKIEKQKQIVEGAAGIEEGFKIFLSDNNTKSIPIRNLCKVRRGASPRPAGDQKYFGGDTYYWLKISDVPKDKKYTESAQEFVTEEGKNKSVLIKAGNIILTNSGATLGYPSILKVDACIHDGFLWFENLSPDIDQEYLFYVFKANRDKLFALAQTGTQPNLNTDLVGDFEIPLPPLETQRQIVEKLDKQMQALEGVQLLKSEAEKRIEEILAGVWGEE